MPAEIRRKEFVSVWGLICWGGGLIDRQEKKSGCWCQGLDIEKTEQPQVSPDVMEVKLTNIKQKSLISFYNGNILKQLFLFSKDYFHL